MYRHGRLMMGKGQAFHGILGRPFTKEEVIFKFSLGEPGNGRFCLFPQGFCFKCPLRALEKLGPRPGAQDPNFKCPRGALENVGVSIGFPNVFQVTLRGT